MIAPHYLRFARALALASGTLLAACSSTTETDGGMDAHAACTCCPTGDWSGTCAMNPMIADASHAPTPPPSGERWCAGTENQQNGCPIAGPMLPPDLAV